MREYKNTETKVLEKIICNGCGKVIPVRNGMAREGVCSVHQLWGYTSGKDGDADDFDLCEECYDRITEQFRIPLTRTENPELL